VEAGDFIADYTDALLIHREVIEDLNSTIRVKRTTKGTLSDKFTDNLSDSLSVYATIQTFLH